MKSSYHATFIRLQMRTNSPKSGFCENWSLKNCHNLNFQKLFFVQKRVSKERNTQNMLAKWLSTKTFRNHDFFKNMPIQKQRSKECFIFYLISKLLMKTRNFELIRDIVLKSAFMNSNLCVNFCILWLVFLVCKARQNKPV